MSRMHAPENPDPGPGMTTGKVCVGVRCPHCGDRFGNLPKHLPGCDGGEV